MRAFHLIRTPEPIVKGVKCVSLLERALEMCNKVLPLAKFVEQTPSIRVSSIETHTSYDKLGLICYTCKNVCRPLDKLLGSSRVFSYKTVRRGFAPHDR